MPDSILLVEAPGLISYAAALRLQEERRDRLIAGAAEPTLFLLQHPPTFTLGSLTEAEDLPCPAAQLEAEGFTVVRTNRGGRATYHGPGQLVAYPVLDLRRLPGSDENRISVRDYLRDLEECVICALRRLEIQGSRVEGAAGVWVGPRKIASTGVAIRQWVTSHGFALNVDMDLAPFHRIRPCGFDPAVMTTAAQEGGRIPPWGALECIVAEEFAAVFGFTGLVFSAQGARNPVEVRG